MTKKKALMDQPHELIKAHILDPENSPLPEQYGYMMDRVISMSKLLDKNPVPKNAVKLHLSKFSDISEVTAWRDLTLARKVYNSIHDFDYDFWLSWALSDIVETIQKCKEGGTALHLKTIAQEHANLIRAIGARPEEPVDPLRNEKHEFYIMVNMNNKSVKLDMNTLHKLPLNTIQELNAVLFAGDEIDEQGAAEIMNS
jgi:hypothetical protein